MVKIMVGTFAEVWEVEYKTTKHARAAKIIKKSMKNKHNNLEHMIKEEIQTLTIVDSPNLMEIFEVFEDKYQYYIVTELLRGPSLVSYLKKLGPQKLNEELIANHLNQILSGLFHCHKKGVVHRDIKLENFMFSDNDCTLIKLIDFGFAKCFNEDNDKFQEILGSPNYIAPEILEKKPYDSKCDIWSCGILAYFLLSGSTPYPIPANGSLSELFDTIRGTVFTMGSFSGSVWDKRSIESKKFILRMLTKEPEKRASAEELLQDPWLKNKITEVDPEISKECFSNLTNSVVNLLIILELS